MPFSEWDQHTLEDLKKAIQDALEHGKLFDDDQFQEMMERLGNLISGYKASTFMHVDHALGPDVAQPYLEQLQGVLAGKTTPAKAAEVTEAAANKAMGAVHS